MKRLIFILAMTLFTSHLCSATQVIKLTTAKQSLVQYSQAEKEYFSDIWGTQVVTNVAKPSLEVFQPKRTTQTDAAIIIAPGGGLYAQSIESEGREVARWLAAKGITAFVLRYRLVPTEKEAVAQLGEEWDANYQHVLKKVGDVLPYSIDDGLNAVEYVRENAKSFNINPNKIGFIGFSAGGAVAMGTGYQYTPANRPDFLVPVYPWTDAIGVQKPQDDAPPMIIICATDDAIGLAKGAIELYSSYFDAGQNVALHMYSKGDHGFGMRKQGLPSDKWIERVYDWLIAEGWVD